MPPVADLHRVGQNSADGLGVGGGAVPAYDLDAGMSRSQDSSVATSRSGRTATRLPVSASMMIVA